MVRLLSVGIFIAWLPHSIARVYALGYDYPIYYLAARGVRQTAWLYPDYIAPVFGWLTFGSSMYWGFVVFYILSILAWAYVASKIKNSVVVGLSIYPMLLALELGQVAPILVAMCCTPVGAVVAGLCKPYCALFGIWHAARIYHKRRVGDGVAEGAGAVRFNVVAKG